ncbi:protein phosphatase CheZ [methane-oxidizing endosymbiont of Gigantopelta aegis]|uniref:protein phosphatase CheZ n=1 Tax=methane-oxidizing endosymbiont of Gigantopelta aegis TaxID=2794938 RepID=UPI0018DD7DA1|nr:protein phosphatase CheZ [methane-oxidizing endosymbiont of Gigantopelta aegis]
MSQETRLALAKDLVKALEENNEAKADAILDEIAGLRESQLFQEIGKLTRQLHDTLSSFEIDAKVAKLTENDIPDAKDRLQYVMTMTEEAADKTLTAVERLLPVSEQLTQQAEELAHQWGRFLDKELPYEEFRIMSKKIAQHFMYSQKGLHQIQSGLNEILMAQSFQDLTGQIIRRVIELVQDLELSMVDLIRLSGGKNKATPVSAETVDEKLPGPAVPGVDDKKGDVAHSQDDVDDLLSSLGF